MATPTPAPLAFKNVRGDILYGHTLPLSSFNSSLQAWLSLKEIRDFPVLRIDNGRIKDFRTQLTQAIPLITTTDQVQGF